MADLSAHWRDSGRIPRLFFIDARVVLLILFWALHMRWWTFTLAIASIIFFSILERFNLPITVAMRLFRTFITGRIKFRGAR